MFVAAGEALAGDSELRGEINKGLVAVLGSFIADQKSGVSSFISDQVKAWDMGQLISLIEINIGKDLQYIRFNGSLIGGLAGLGALHRRIPAALAVTISSRRRLLNAADLLSCVMCDRLEWRKQRPSFHDRLLRCGTILRGLRLPMVDWPAAET